MKKAAILSFVLICFMMFSCKKDDAGGCTTCTSPETMPFEVCEERDGNAWVNGENTGTDYDTYLADLLRVGVECGGM